MTALSSCGEIQIEDEDPPKKGNPCHLCCRRSPKTHLGARRVGAMLREGEDHPEGSRQLGWLEESHGISHHPLKSASPEDKGDVFR